MRPRPAAPFSIDFHQTTVNFTFETNTIGRLRFGLQPLQSLQLFPSLLL